MRIIFNLAQYVFPLSILVPKLADDSEVGGSTSSIGAKKMIGGLLTTGPGGGRGRNQQRRKRR